MKIIDESHREDLSDAEVCKGFLQYIGINWIELKAKAIVSYHKNEL